MTTSASDLQRIFAADPLSLTKDDLAALVADLRAKRAQWVGGGQKPEKAEKVKLTKQELDVLDI